MGTFDNILMAERDVYKNDYGADAVYRKKTRVERSIVCIPEYEPPDMPAGGVAGARTILIVSVDNNVTTGITATEIDFGADQIDVATRQGGPLKTMTIAHIVSQDAGSLRLQLRQ